MSMQEKRLEELEQEVEVKERTLQELSRPSQHQPEEQLDGRIREDEGLDEAKIVSYTNVTHWLNFLITRRYFLTSGWRKNWSL